MKLPITAHTSRPWLIHSLTQGFWPEDVWTLPTPRALFAVRLKLGDITS